MSDNYRDFEALADNRSAQVIQIEGMGKGERAAYIISIVFSVALSALAIGIAGRAHDLAKLSEREARISQDKLVYVESELVRQGININTKH